MNRITFFNIVMTLVKFEVLPGDLGLVKLMVAHGADVLGSTMDGSPFFKVSTFDEINRFLFWSRFHALCVPVILILLGASLSGLVLAALHNECLPRKELVGGFAPLERSPTKEPAKEPAGNTSKDPPVASSFYDFLESNYKCCKWFGHFLETFCTTVIFGFGMAVVSWMLWIPLHLVLYGAHWALGASSWQDMVTTPALLITGRLRMLSLARTLLLLGIVNRTWSLLEENFLFEMLGVCICCIRLSL